MSKRLEEFRDEVRRLAGALGVSPNGFLKPGQEPAGDLHDDPFLPQVMVSMAYAATGALRWRRGRISSYGWKHSCERWAKGAYSVPYVCNGALIVGCAMAGMTVKRLPEGMDAKLTYPKGWEFRGGTVPQIAAMLYDLRLREMVNMTEGSDND